MKKLLLLLLLLTLIGHAAHASQYNPVLPTSSPYPGLTMLGNINSAFQGILSNNSGASAPSYGIEGTLFTNTSSGLLEYYSGSNWLNIGKFSSTQFVPISNGVPYTIPSSTGSSNAYVVTYSPAPTAYVTGQHYPFIANFANTTTASENVNGLGAKQITKRGTVALASGDIPSGAAMDTVYDGTEMQMISQLGNAASGTVTSVTCGTGLAGGTFTTSGTCGLGTIANGDFLANTSGSIAAPSQTTLTAYLDAIIGNTRGGIIERGVSGWTKITPGTTGTVLTSNGAAADPSYQTVGGGMTLLSSTNASAVSSVSFGSGFLTSSYKKYVLEWDGAFASSGGSLCLQISSNNGSTILSGNNYYWAGWQVNGSGTLSAYTELNGGGGGQAAFQITGTSFLGTTASNPSEGTIKFSNPSATSYPMFFWNSSVFNGTTAPISYQANASYNDGGSGLTFNFVQINTCGSGATISGHFALYGLSP